MKIKVERELNPLKSEDSNYYMVYIDGRTIKAFCFKLDEPEDSSWNEEKAKKNAMAYVNKFETLAKSGVPEKIIEIVYENEIETNVPVEKILPF